VGDTTTDLLREEVRSRYAEAARAVLEPRPGVTAQCIESSATGSCCGTGSAGLDSADCFGGPLYGQGETDGLPTQAVLASLGCGNPIAVADLRQGERVLDLGSGGGIDVLLSARRVGPSGFVYGVDMTEEMLTLARANAARAGAANVEFLPGQIEAVPLPDAAVDVVISNCVAGSYPGCIAGPLSRSEYLAGLAAAGFADTSATFTTEAAPGLHSAIIRAIKPAQLAG
jgi:arsenite methyltransferase